MTKEKVDTLLKWLDKLGLGMGDSDAARQLQSQRSDALLALVVLAVLYLVPH